MSIIFEFLYSSKFHSISNLFLLFSSLFSHFSVSFQSVLLFVYKRRSALASFLRHFPHVFVWESSEKKAQPVTDSSVDSSVSHSAKRSACFVTQISFKYSPLIHIRLQLLLDIIFESKNFYENLIRLTISQ